MKKKNISATHKCSSLAQWAIRKKKGEEIKSVLLLHKYTSCAQTCRHCTTCQENKQYFAWRPNSKGCVSGLQIITRQDFRRATGKAHQFALGLSKKFKPGGDENGPSFEETQPPPEPNL